MRNAKIWVWTILISTVSVSAHALDADDLDDLLGYTLVASTNVSGEFEGCDFDKRIKLDNGMVLICGNFSFSYAYRPKALVFSKAMNFQGRSYSEVKVVIGDAIYDMQPVIAR